MDRLTEIAEKHTERCCDSLCVEHRKAILAALEEFRSYLIGEAARIADEEGNGWRVVMSTNGWTAADNIASAIRSLADKQEG